MTIDGGFERLITILHDFFLSPPPPENPHVCHGLLPLNFRPPKPSPTLNPRIYDRAAAARFSIAFQWSSTSACAARSPSARASSRSARAMSSGVYRRGCRARATRWNPARRRRGFCASRVSSAQSVGRSRPNCARVNSVNSANRLPYFLARSSRSTSNNSPRTPHRARNCPSVRMATQLATCRRFSPRYASSLPFTAYDQRF